MGDMMSFVATFLLGGLAIQTAAAVDWPDLSEPAQQAINKSNDRADIIIALEEYENLIGVRNAAVNSDDWERYFTIGLGLPSSQVSVLKDSTADRMRIENEIEARRQNFQARWGNCG